ncbi:hypothetical protein [Kitasatospora cystarginea]
MSAEPSDLAQTTTGARVPDSLDRAAWRRTALSVLVAAVAGVACTSYADWAKDRAWEAAHGDCVPYPGMPLSAQAAAWAGAVVGALVVIAIPLLLWTGTRKPEPVQSLLIPLLKAMLFASLLMLLFEVGSLLAALPDFHPHGRGGDCSF